MKTSVLFSVLVATLMFASANVFGGKPQCTMPFYTAKGIVQIQVKVEETPDSLPDCVKLSIEKRHQEWCCLVAMQFDLSTISKTEQDADDVIINTRQIFKQIQNPPIARK
jgi:hypothetical protein